jgi:hypothetical protein
MTDVELRAALMEQVAPAQRNTEFAKTLVDSLVARRKIFNRLDVSETTVVVDMKMIGTPKPVSFKVPIRRGAQGNAATEGLLKWVAAGVARQVPWDTPAYGFAIVVPKADGRWRVTINPTETNRVTERIEISGGYMADSMVREAQRAGRGARWAALLDFAEAFTSLKLGPTAQAMSVFTTPIGKVQWLQGYFGWHSFPPAFQRAMMEKVILPAESAVQAAVLLAWIDDVFCGADSPMAFLAALHHVIDNALAVGWRLSLKKCLFLHDVFDWCGVEIDVENSQWRVSKDRVKSLTDTPLPKDRDALLSGCGVLRYYYFGITKNHMAQRERLAKLLELDVPGIVLRDKWTDEHTRAWKDAFEEVASGDWLLVFDPTKKVYVTCDAAGKLGYGVVAFQFDDVTRTYRPISYFSAGWLSTQLLWSPQVKECYAKRQAVCVIMYKAFPFAYVVLLNDNKNLSAPDVVSADPRVVRWRHDIDCSGVSEQYWIPGDWNSIADYASRSVQPDERAKLSEEERFEMYLYAMYEEYTLAAITTDEGSLGEGEGAGAPASPLIPGHFMMAPMVAKIAKAQADAPEKERKEWAAGGFYSTAVLGDTVLHLWKDRLIVPESAAAIRKQLMQMAHDGGLHYTGASRTQWALTNQARVHWRGIDRDVKEFVASCFKCTFAKADHVKATDVGTLSPTVAPWIHHTWYADMKGPLPHETGYILVVVEALTGYVRLRYLPKATAQEVNEELLEVMVANGTRPVVLRVDGGPPFDSKEFKAFCLEEGVKAIPGAPYHSQGQGLVENRIRGIAASIMAVLGNKAEREWFKGPLLGRLEGVINSAVIEGKGCSPYGAMFGREPRTALSATADWSSDSFGERALGAPGVTLEDVNEIIARHHAVVRAVEQRLLIGTSVQQALTKRSWEAERKPGTYTVGEYIIVRVQALTRLRSWYNGPYRITRVTACGNFVYGPAFVDPAQIEAGPFHVTRIRRIDMSRATVDEVAAHQLESGSGVVVTVKDHRVLADGSYEFEIEWFGMSQTSWVPSTGVRRVTKVIDYCSAKGLKAPGTENAKPAVAVRGGAARGSRGRGRGRGRGGVAR